MKKVVKCIIIDYFFNPEYEYCLEWCKVYANGYEALIRDRYREDWAKDDLVELK